MSVNFLCGRPGCGKESTATLQIDAPSQTVSLVDPRISRDGVPLCARHADATTPPMGWAMNDLRTRNRALAAVPDEASAVVTSTPPRVRPDDESAEGQTAEGRQMSRRQSIAERARRREEGRPGAEAPAPAATAETAGTGVVAEAETEDHRFESSRSGAAAEDTRPTAKGKAKKRKDDAGPASRPTRRRDVVDEAQEDEEKFPWHHQFENDEPEELQASTPLLSRAFRSSIG